MARWAPRPRVWWHHATPRRRHCLRCHPFRTPASVAAPRLRAHVARPVQRARESCETAAGRHHPQTASTGDTAARCTAPWPGRQHRPARLARERCLVQQALGVRPSHALASAPASSCEATDGLLGAMHVAWRGSCHPHAALPSPRTVPLPECQRRCVCQVHGSLGALQHRPSRGLASAPVASCEATFEWPDVQSAGCVLTWRWTHSPMRRHQFQPDAWA